MRHWLLLLIAAVIVAGIAYTVVWIFTGGEDGLSPNEPDGRAVPLPGTRPLEEGDIIAAKFDTALRGYRMAQVDAALRRTAYDVGYKQELIDVLEAEVDALRAGRLSDADRLRAARLSALAGTDAAARGGRHTAADEDDERLLTHGDDAALAAGYGSADDDAANWNADTLYRLTDSPDAAGHDEEAGTPGADALDSEADVDDRGHADHSDTSSADGEPPIGDAASSASSDFESNLADGASAETESGTGADLVHDGAGDMDGADNAKGDGDPAGPDPRGEPDVPDTAKLDGNVGGAAGADGDAAADAHGDEPDVGTVARQTSRETGSLARTNAKASGRRTKSGR